MSINFFNLLIINNVIFTLFLPFFVKKTFLNCSSYYNNHDKSVIYRLFPHLSQAIPSYHPACQLFPSHLISLLLNLSFAECHKALFWALSILICKPPISVLSLISLPSHTSFMQMIPNSSSLSFLKTFPLLSLT